MDDAIWANSTPPVLRRRRRDRQSDGVSRSGATRPQNGITWSLNAVSLMLGGVLKLEIMKILETIKFPDGLLTAISRDTIGLCHLLTKMITQGNPQTDGQIHLIFTSSRLSSLEMIIICSTTAGPVWRPNRSLREFAFIERLESAPVSGGDFNNRLF